ncbi:unnamed protein product [Acanthoscelides obtectus]|uniref:Uncharacterized protein n=1 Tax=Acanthoscelides obtectus TaxID=200917 RepID=A0A9P0NW02_ACAOB|nr:unnamed protein product [Acanthoscelides obtectus]CAK1665819.1 hypothetical protein AOBTE_LOCUS24980 [Acanthoscelides obtectus]
MYICYTSIAIAGGGGAIGGAPFVDLISETAPNIIFLTTIFRTERNVYIEFTLSPYKRLLVIDLSALTICALVMAGFSTRSSLASSRLRRKLTKSTSKACFTNWSWLLENRRWRASHATATMSRRACIACFKGCMQSVWAMAFTQI